MADLLSSIVDSAASAANPVSAVANLLSGAMDRFIPDATAREAAKEELTKQTLNGELQKYLDDNALLKAQITVDDDEAKSTDKYTSRARPTVIYGALGLVIWSLGIVPVMVWVITWIHSDAPKPPALDTTLAVTLLLGLLGLHTYENTRP